MAIFLPLKNQILIQAQLNVETNEYDITTAVYDISTAKNIDDISSYEEVFGHDLNDDEVIGILSLIHI